MADIQADMAPREPLTVKTLFQDGVIAWRSESRCHGT